MAVKTFFEPVVLAKEKFDKFADSYERLAAFVLQADLEECEDKRVDVLKQEVQVVYTDFCGTVVEYMGRTVVGGDNSKKRLLAFVTHAKGRYTLASHVDEINDRLTDIVRSVDDFGMKECLGKEIKADEGKIAELVEAYEGQIKYFDFIKKDIEKICQLHEHSLACFHCCLVCGDCASVSN